MKIKTGTFLMICTMGILSCSDPKEQQETTTTAAEHQVPLNLENITLAIDKDPVCKMPVKKEGISDTAHYKGNVYGFCNIACKEQFKNDPEKYLKE
jgi:YHS domain-containing protein